MPPAAGDVIERTLAEVGAAADGVLSPLWMQDMSDADAALFGVAGQDTRAFAAQAPRAA